MALDFTGGSAGLLSDVLAFLTDSGPPNWKDQLRPGTFRGIPFFIDAHEASTGRRVVQHEFPNRDTPYSEDMGKKGGAYSIDGHILGDEYFGLRDKLQAACEQEGPGELVHPYLGTLQVNCDTLSIKEDTKEGRIVRFTMTFFEAGEIQFPAQLEDKVAGVNNASDAIREENANIFEQVMSVANSPAHVVDAAASAVGAVATVVNNVAKLPGAVASGAAELAFSTRALLRDVTTLLNTPKKLAERMANSIALLASVFPLAEDARKAFAGLKNFGDDFEEIIGSTVSREKQRINNGAFIDFVKREAIARQAEQAAISTFFSVSEGLEIRDDILDQIRAQKEQDGISDDLFQMLSDLEANLIDTVPGEDQGGGLKEVSYPITLSSLWVTYDVYESLDYEQDIIDRNDIGNPGFIQGGKILEVIV